MSKKQFLFLVTFLGVIGLHNITFAAEGFVTDLPWDSSLTIMTNNVRTVARAIVAIMVAVTGTMVLFDAGSANAIKCARIVLGIGLCLNVADFILADDGLFAGLFHILNGNITQPTPPNINFGGSDKGINFIGDFMTYYERMCIYGASMLIPSALKLLGFLVVIDMTVTLMFKLEGDHIQYVMHQIIKVGFFIFLIQSWVGGSGAIQNIANIIFTSFEQIGINATGMTELGPESIISNGFSAVSIVLTAIGDGILKGNMLLACVGAFISLVIFICVAITGLELIICRLEFWTISLIIVPLIPFGCYKHTRFLFERAIGAVFNLGIKMAIVSFICIISGPLIAGLVERMSADGIASNLNLTGLLMVFFGTLVIAVLAVKAPALASGLFNGQPSLGSGDMVGMATNAARTVSSGAGAVVQASNMAGGATALNAINKAGGPHTGFVARQAGTLRNLATMANQAYNPFSQGYNSAQSSIRDRMTRNASNAEIQNMGHNPTKDLQGNISAGWKPTLSANQQNEEIKRNLEDLKKNFGNSGLKDSNVTKK